MFCPDCGYSLTAFDKECPRCARRRVGGIPPPGLPIHVGPARDTPDPDQTIAYQSPPPQNGKVCPSCSTLADVAAPYCLRCGHQYRTAFPPNVQPPVQYPPPQYPPAQYAGQPPQYQPYQQPYQSQQPPYPPPYGQYPSPYQLGMIQVPPGSHGVAAAVILALLINGAGQMVNKQVSKGVVILLSAIVLTAVTFGLAWPVICLVSLIDAVCIANRLNRGEPIGPWQWF